MAVELTQNEHGQYVLAGCFYGCEDTFTLGHAEEPRVSPFYIGIDTFLKPAQIRIAFDPAESNNQIHNGDIGLYTALSVMIDGFPMPGAVFPELDYMKSYQEIFNLDYTWPAMASAEYLRESALGAAGTLAPLYPLNYLLKRPAAEYNELFLAGNPLGALTTWPRVEENGMSQVASMALPLGMDFLGPFGEELNELLHMPGREPWCELPLEDVEIFDNGGLALFVCERIGVPPDAFKRIQSYDGMLLFQYADEEEISSYICAVVGEEAVGLFELENIEIEELQRNRIRKLFENFKEFGGYRPIDWRNKRADVRGGGKGKNHLLYEMDGANFTIKGRTYAIALNVGEDGLEKAVWDVLLWWVSMRWNAEEMSFSDCEIRYDSFLLQPKAYAGNHVPPCCERYMNYLNSGKIEEPDLHQRIWFDVF